MRLDVVKMLSGAARKIALKETILFVMKFPRPPLLLTMMADRGSGVSFVLCRRTILSRNK